jgi:hypothetical protein
MAFEKAIGEAREMLHITVIYLLEAGVQHRHPKLQSSMVAGMS